MPDRVHRRLAAIVAADVVGYSRAVEADEAATLARLSEVRRGIIDPAIARHQGRLVKTIGDGLLLEFASVVDAVRATIEIQETLAERNSARPESERILYRIGVNIGDVVVDGEDLLGDGVNVAARLESIAEPGGICLAEAACQQLAGRLDIALVDAGPQRLKNIDRPVRAFRWQPGAGRAGQSAGGQRAAAQRRRVVPAALALLALAGLTGVWWLLDGAHEPGRSPVPGASESRLQARGRTAVAVLPFANLSGEKDREYFSDGLTEEVIGALGRFSALSVLSRNAVMPLKGKAQPTADMAKALGVRYLVDGTVRSDGARIRVSVHLSDAIKGRLLWSEQFDGEMRDIISVQERIAQRVVAALAVRLTRAEQERAAKLPTENLEAYDLVLRGRAQLSTLSRRANVEARTLFQRAIALDARYADAYVGLGLSYREAIMLGWLPDAHGSLVKAEEAARQAIRLDDRNSRAHALLGQVLVLREEFDQAKAASRRAIELNPSDAEGYVGLGAVLLWSGATAEAIDALETARAYDGMLASGSVFHLSLAYYLADRPGAVINHVEGIVGRRGQTMYTLVVLSMAYADLGQQDKAADVVSMARQLNPTFDPQRFGTLLRDPALRAKVRQGLAKAGWL